MPTNNQSKDELTHCEYEHPIEGCCLCAKNCYKQYHYAKGITHWHEYCELGRKNMPYGWWERNGVK